jgi:hypothetical protein
VRPLPLVRTNTAYLDRPASRQIYYYPAYGLSTMKLKLIICATLSVVFGLSFASAQAETIECDSSSRTNPAMVALARIV